jgi:protein SCO1/2
MISRAMMKRLRRHAKWIMGAAAAALIGAGVWSAWRYDRAQIEFADEVEFLAPPELSALGRSIDTVTLVGGDGKDVAWKDLNGRPRLVFFGFTHCPQICPDTLARVARAQELAGLPADAFFVDFVSVDPERDAPRVMKDYVQSFGPHVRGLTGEAPAIKQVAESFRIGFIKSALEDGGYSVDHGVTVFLLDAAGNVVSKFGTEAAPEQIAEQLRALIATL